MSVDERPQPAEDPPVGVMIKATVLDAPFLDAMVRHMIAQARYPFAERVIIVDRPRTFTGKYSTRHRASDRELDRTVEGLLRAGIVDTVHEVDPAPHRLAEVTERYFESHNRPVPRNAATGGRSTRRSSGSSRCQRTTSFSWTPTFCSIPTRRAGFAGRCAAWPRTRAFG